jgi:hypothetical protein
MLGMSPVQGMATAAVITVTSKYFYDNMGNRSGDAHLKEFDALPGNSTHLTRIHETRRSDWEKRCRQIGFNFAALPGITWGANNFFTNRETQPYWNEASSIRVSGEGMWEVEKAAFECHSMCLEAVAEIVESDELLQEFGIPKELWPAVRESWRR